MAFLGDTTGDSFVVTSLVAVTSVRSVFCSNELKTILTKLGRVTSLSNNPILGTPSRSLLYPTFCVVTILHSNTLADRTAAETTMA